MVGVVTLMIPKWSSGPSFLKDKPCSQLDSSRSLKTILYISLPLPHLFQTCNVSVGVFLPLFMASDDGDDVFVCVRSVIQLCSTLFDLMDSSPQVSSVHGISQARMQVQVDVSYSRGSTHPGLNPHLLHWQADSLPLQPLVG